MTGCRRLASCRNLFKNLKILSLMSQYIFSVMMFIIKHKHQFTVNSEIHNINTRHHSNLHQPAPNLTGFKHGIYYSGVKIHNNLPLYIKQLADDPRTFELKFKKISVFSLILLGRILPTPILILNRNNNHLKYGIRKQTTIRRKV